MEITPNYGLVILHYIWKILNGVICVFAFWSDSLQLNCTHKSMDSYKKDVTPLLMHWRCIFLVLTHWYVRVTWQALRRLGDCPNDSKISVMFHCHWNSHLIHIICINPLSANNSNTMKQSTKNCVHTLCTMVECLFCCSRLCLYIYISFCIMIIAIFDVVFCYPSKYIL